MKTKPLLFPGQGWSVFKSETIRKVMWQGQNSSSSPLRARQVAFTHPGSMDTNSLKVAVGVVDDLPLVISLTVVFSGLVLDEFMSLSDIHCVFDLLLHPA